MVRHDIRIGETIATVIVDPQYIPLVETSVMEARERIRTYILTHPEFRTSLIPVSVESDAPDIVKIMAETGKVVNVGPMAAVAGAIAQYVVEVLVAAGAKHIVFDNGGDIAMYLDEPIVIGLYAGKNGLDGIGFKVSEKQTILGICTSSFTVGHSLSFGKTDASTAVSNNVALADAAATALGNQICNADENEIERAMDSFNREGIDGLLVTIGDLVGISGNLPDIVRANVEYNLISRGKGVEY